jgi:outer membrane protein
MAKVIPDLNCNRNAQLYLALQNLKMKNFQNIAILILSLAVAFLLYRQFATSEESQAKSETETKPKMAIFLKPDTSNAYGSVAFVNTDSLLEQFESFKKMRSGFEKKSAMAENDIANRMRTLEAEYMEVQKKIQSGVMTETLIKDAEQSLMRKQQELAMLRDQKTSQLVDEEKNLTKKLNDQIFDFMQEYAPQHGLKYVLGYTRGGGILYAADSLDITDAVLEGLNTRYKGK